jgi:hypothetical protein
MNSAVKMAVLIALALAANLAQAATPRTPTFFARRGYPGYSYCVQVADTNGDKIPDLITNGFGNVNVLLGNGDGTFRPGPYTRISASNSYSFVPADFNGDGKIDLEFSKHKRHCGCDGKRQRHVSIWRELSHQRRQCVVFSGR